MTALEQFAADIIKSLESLEAASGTRAGSVFDDFLTATLLTLERLPDHLESATTTGRLAEPTADEAETFEKMHDRYSRIRDIDCRDYFAPAFNVLLESTAYGYMDVLGVVYMQYGYPGEGQVFTPYHVAEMMAQMTIGDAQDLHGFRLLVDLNLLQLENPAVRRSLRSDQSDGAPVLPLKMTLASGRWSLRSHGCHNPMIV
jgi:hypothetical protein